MKYISTIYTARGKVRTWLGHQRQVKKLKKELYHRDYDHDDPDDERWYSAVQDIDYFTRT